MRIMISMKALTILSLILETTGPPKFCWVSALSYSSFLFGTMTHHTALLYKTFATQMHAIVAKSFWHLQDFKRLATVF